MALALDHVYVHGRRVKIDQGLSILERVVAFFRRNKLSDEERARLADDRARRKEFAARRALLRGKLDRAEQLGKDAEALRQEAADFRALPASP